MEAFAGFGQNAPVQTPGLSFPQVIDSTMRSDYVACKHKFFEAHILNLRGVEANVHLHFGGCFAKGLEVFRRSFWGAGIYRGRFLQSFKLGAEAIIKAWGDAEKFSTANISAIHGGGANKTLEGCLDAYISFFEKYPPESDPITPLMVNSEPAVEFSFALPIPHISHPETGGPILYAGRFDMLATYGTSPNSVFVNDEKTTVALGATWANNWRLRGQLTGYAWGAEEYGYPIGGVIVRGVSILKRDIGHAFVLEHRHKFQIERWLHQLTRDVEAMIRSWNEGYWDYAFDTACTNFGGCGYMDICKSEDQDTWRKKFIVSPWDPLAKH